MPHSAVRHSPPHGVEHCPFCSPEPGRVFLRLPLVCALWDGFPVTPGHALIVPHRHVATWFDATAAEQAAITDAISLVRDLIRRHYPADGFNLGVNSGEAAGQTIAHLHLHVIPRRTGDVANPRGGVRHVIPGKGNYAADAPPAQDFPAADSAAPASKAPAPTSRVPAAPTPLPDPLATSIDPHEVMLTTGGTDPLLPRLEEDIAEADQIDIAVAFVQRSGVARVHPHFEELLARGGRLRLLTGDYLGITDPDALNELLDLQALHPGQVALRVFETRGTSFHPKAYLLLNEAREHVAYVGSSNLSASALEQGIEWNYRVSERRDRQGVARVRSAFEELFGHPQTVLLDAPWVAAYRARRPILTVSPRQALPGEPVTETLPSAQRAAVDVEVEAPPAPPVPNAVQQEALAALEATRAAGNRAGLVVMATGLGKTWLAAFDSEHEAFRRVLFVAHREEILSQALATFRRICPAARFGLYTGNEREPEADIIFASIQTLGRTRHLERFARDAFDYIVVDEFHHASATTYRRLIDHFDPAFLLGLTATPERTDGGNLMGLCGENLVYECGVMRGIEAQLLAPYRYFGVPDAVDYQNIPWRGRRFDEESLTTALATQARAANVFEQWQTKVEARDARRTLAFCVSQRHAEFMRSAFRARGVACAAVHAGAGSDPRTLSLERLARGELQVIFAVDMFNEGVDVPAIDTVMMLRPTESPVVWLQQFGRGLRRLGDKCLTVIDYIGNHRSFLMKVRALLQIAQTDGDAGIRRALAELEEGTRELPPGCAVTYDLQVIDIVRALLRTAAPDALAEYYADFREREGIRPTASEALHDGYRPRSATRGAGSWLGLVEAMGDLADDERAVLAGHRVFLAGLETTPMSKSYKMLVLLAMLNTDMLPGEGIGIEALAAECARIAGRTQVLQEDIGAAIDDARAMVRLIRENPVAAWTGAGAIPGRVVFAFEENRFRFMPDVAAGSRPAFQRLVREIADWRLAEYLSRRREETGTGGFEMRVSHANGRPMLFLPSRAVTPGIPEGVQRVVIEGEAYEANFVKVATNVLHKPGASENVMAAVMRSWFGPDAGMPGTDHRVWCERDGEGWVWRRVGASQTLTLEPMRRYAREQIPTLFGHQFSQAIWNSGFVVLTPRAPKDVCLLVTLEKDGMPDEFQYADRFTAPDTFVWHSQNRTTQKSKHGRLIASHVSQDIRVHLFVRRTKRRGTASAPFVYCGPVVFQAWEAEKPITVTWKLKTPLTRDQFSEFLGSSTP